jgi:hypothetical protein
VTQFTLNKKVIVTTEMLRTFPKDSRYDLRTALLKWWINSRRAGGLRLTSAGFNLLNEMDYDSYEFQAEKLTTSKNLLVLDQKLDCPYYINGIGGPKSKITLLGSKEAMMITLCGNFNSYLATLHLPD